MAALAGAALLRGGLGVRALSTAADQLWATALEYRSADKVLEVEFSTGERFSLPVEYLRAESPAAEARDRAGRPKVVGGRRHVGILGIHPVGSYAVRLEFDDLHSSGIYTWPYLHELGRHKLSRMRQYIRALRERGLSRDPSRLRARRGAAGQQQAGVQRVGQPPPPLQQQTGWQAEQQVEQRAGTGQPQQRSWGSGSAGSSMPATRAT